MQHANGIEGWLAVLASGERATAARRIWDDAVVVPEWDGVPSWIHGDLHPANVVVANGTLSGVVDFGELCAADPAADLAAAWVLLPAGTAPRFLDTYGICGRSHDPARPRMGRTARPGPHRDRAEMGAGSSRR
jgi:aminoglycoside phosphotransferase (APT) family kinase protein